MRMNEEKKRNTIGPLTAAYINSINNCERIGKPLHEQLEKINSSISSNNAKRLEATINYGSGLVYNFTEEKKPLASYILMLFFKDEGWHDLSPEMVRAGISIKVDRIFKSIDQSFSRSFKNLWVDGTKLETNIKDALAYLESIGFVKYSNGAEDAKLDRKMGVELTGNGALAARALEKYMASKISSLKRG